MVTLEILMPELAVTVTPPLVVVTVCVPVPELVVVSPLTVTLTKEYPPNEYCLVRIE